MYEQLKQNIIDLVGNEYLYFDTKLHVNEGKINAFDAWGVCVSANGTIYLMDYAQDWYSIEDNLTEILNQVETKVNQIKKHYYG